MELLCKPQTRIMYATNEKSETETNELCWPVVTYNQAIYIILTLVSSGISIWL